MSNHSIKYILAPYVSVGFIDSNLVYGFGSITTVIPKEYSDIHTSLLKASALLTKNPLTVEELRSTLINIYFFTQELAEKTIDFLIGNNFIIPEELKVNRDYRYSRCWDYYIMNLADPRVVLNNLANSHVCFIGCGGIGSLMSVILSANGVGELTLIDDDLIHESNLTSQIIFSEKNIGKNKVEALKEEINLKNSSCKVNILKHKIDDISKFNLLPKCDLVVISGDEHKDVIKQVKNFLQASCSPYMEVGYSVDYPKWSLISDFSHNYEEKQIDYLNFKEEIEAINENMSPPSMAHINLISIGFAVQDALFYLGKFSSPLAKQNTIHLAIDKLKFIKHN